MKNLDKILFALALVACIGGGVAYALLASPAAGKSSSAKRALKGAEVVAWTDASAAKTAEAPAVWKAPAFDLEEGWNYDLFSSPEISWDTKQKKYFAKELPPPPEEVFGLTLKSITRPTFRLVFSSYSAGTRPVPEMTPEGRYAAVLSLFDLSGATPVARMVNFARVPMTLSDETNAAGVRTVVLTPEAPVTIEKTNARLKSFRIRRWTDAETGAFRETLDAVVIDDSGAAPREFVLDGNGERAADKNRIEAVFTDGYTDWRYSETRVPGRKTPVIEIARKGAADDAFEVVSQGNEIRIGGDVFRVKELDFSAQKAKIEKQSSEPDKKTKAPKTTERVLSPER